MNDTTDDRPAAPRRARHLMDPNAPQRDTINSVGTTRVQTWVMSTLVVTTILHLAGFDHEQLTYRFNGRDFRLTDVGGKVIDKLLA